MNSSVQLGSDLFKSCIGFIRAKIQPVVLDLLKFLRYPLQPLTKACDVLCSTIRQNVHAGCCLFNVALGLVQCVQFSICRLNFCIEPFNPGRSKNFKITLPFHRDGDRGLVGINQRIRNIRLNRYMDRGNICLGDFHRWNIHRRCCHPLKLFIQFLLCL